MGRSPQPRQSPSGAAFAALTVLAVLAASCARPADVGGGSGVTEPEAEEVTGAQPGELLDEQPVTLVGNARAQAWRITYRSTGVSGDPVPVTGFVLAPATVAEGAPVVAWGHGTTGLADVCAPSRYAEAMPVPLAQQYLDAGYVIVATDYEGLGTDGPHPYLVGSSEARSVLDSVRAAGELLGALGPVVLAGHSQGGHAALFAAEAAGADAPELDIVGVVAIAPAADPEVILSAAAIVPQLFVLSFIGLTAYAEVYPELSVEAVFTPRVLRELGRLEEHCSNDPALVRPFQNLGAGRLFALDPSQRGSWRARFAENRAGDAPLPVPVLVVQGGRDQLVPPEMSEELVDRLCRGGTEAALQWHQHADHADVVRHGQDGMLEWIAARVAGDPLTDAC